MAKDGDDTQNNRPHTTVVVNAFNPKCNERLDAMVRLNLILLLEYTTPPFDIILVNAGGVADEPLEQFCREHGIAYHQPDEPLPFAEGYNYGLSRAGGDYIALCASDILVAPEWNSQLIAEMDRTGAWMAIPVLSYSDVGTQNRNFCRGPKTFRPVSMTFNLNLMTRHTRETIGLINESLTGAFNDNDYLLRIRQAGGEVIQTDAGNISHLGRATITVATNYTQSKDFQTYRTMWTWRDSMRNRLTGVRGFFYVLLESLARAMPIPPLRRRLLRSVLKRQPWFYSR